MTELQVKAIERIKEVYAKAESVYGVSFKLPTISFKLKGRRAGYAIPAYNSITLNNDMLNRNGDAFINDTPGHEAAHLIAYDVYGYMIDPHGKEWKKVMVDVCGQEPNRCHNFEVVTRHEYFCNCTETIYLSTTKHNRYIKGRTKYYCKKCKVPIKWKKLYEKTSIISSVIKFCKKAITAPNY